MVFIDWLQGELDKRGWSQSELVKRSQAVGYPLSQAQFSRIMTGVSQAGPDACIAIAHTLNIEREEVFRARGWLPYSFKETDLKLSIEAAQLAVEVDRLPPTARRIVLRVAKATAKTLREEAE
jgi:transcriptional regulator with XRE-family HTH domain